MVLKVLKAKSPGEKMMEQVLKSDSVMFVLTVQQYSRSLTTSVSQTLRDMSVCVYTLQDESAEIDENTFESCWVCLPVDFHCTRG